MTFFELIEALRKYGRIRLDLPDRIITDLTKFLDSYEGTLKRKLNEIEIYNFENRNSVNFQPKRIQNDNEAKVKKNHLEYVFKHINEAEQIKIESVE